MPLGKRVRTGVEQNARGIDAGRGNDHALSHNAVLFFGVAIEVLNAAGAAFVVDEHARRNGVVDDADTARLHAQARSDSRRS